MGQFCCFFVWRWDPRNSRASSFVFYTPGDLPCFFLVSVVFTLSTQTVMLSNLVVLHTPTTLAHHKLKTACVHPPCLFPRFVHRFRKFIECMCAPSLRCSSFRSPLHYFRKCICVHPLGVVPPLPALFLVRAIVLCVTCVRFVFSVAF